MTELPLAEKKIVVTRSWQQSPSFSEKLTDLGATVIEMPTLVITPPDSWQALDGAIANLGQFHWLILTSANGVHYFFERLTHAYKTKDDLAHLQIAVVGAKTADLLMAYGVMPNIIPANFIADSLIEALQHQITDWHHQQILFPRVQSGGRDILISELTKLGAVVTAVPAYESRCPERIDPLALSHLQTGTVDFITFASSKTVQNFCYLLSQVTHQSTWQTWLRHSKFIAIGAQTADTCQTLLGRVDATATVSTLEGMIAAILNLVQ